MMDAYASKTRADSTTAFATTAPETRGITPCTTMQYTPPNPIPNPSALEATILSRRTRRAKKGHQYGLRSNQERRVRRGREPHTA